VLAKLPIRSGDITLRLLKRRDAHAIEELMRANRDWLRPWTATFPGSSRPIHVPSMVRALVADTREGIGIGLALEWRGQIVGQVNVANILHGAVQSASIGYWISQSAAGNSIIPRAVALTIDYLFRVVNLHRIEIEIRPENAASLRVVEKLGLREEGLKLRHIHIDGEWRDHRCFAMTIEELPNSRVSQLVANTPSK
jgi:ribosomal-protein-alanine N-acetyltransferase